METLFLLGLAAVLLSIISGLSARPTQPPPPIIFVQTVPPEQTGGAGCLPMIILVAVVLVAVTLW